ncbi:MAG: hypothetical protein KDJ33_14710 [Gammaproteobacteria bacterium]|nr:hypothetical protein [Gammaproteobacteria bacterium]
MSRTPIAPQTSRTLLMACALFLSCGVANAVVVYQNDFETSDLTGWSVIGTNPGVTADLAGEHVFGLFNDNQTITWSQSLAAGTYAVAFDFFAINSWDEVDSGCCFPDGFAVEINGVTVFDEDDPFSLTLTGSDVLSFVYPGPDRIGEAVSNERYRPAFAVTHGGGAFTLSVIGQTSQPGQTLGDTGFFDEPWAIDNVLIDRLAVPVPLPGSLGLLLAGIAGMAATRRHRGD